MCWQEQQPEDLNKLQQAFYISFATPLEMTVYSQRFLSAAPDALEFPPGVESWSPGFWAYSLRYATYRNNSKVVK